MMSNSEFNSVFAEEFKDFIDLKRVEGFKYESEEQSFKRIDAFFCNHNLSEKIITKELCDEWTRKRSYESENNRAHRISAFRVFADYLNDLGYDVYSPPKNIIHHVPKYVPHIYTDDELKRFFKAVDQSKSLDAECPYRGEIMPVFFRILYTSGLRVSELRLLKIKDFNLDESYITIREGKNNKDRIVPVNSVLTERCKNIKNSILSGCEDDDYFFPIRPGEPMKLLDVYRNFRRYLENAGISHTGKGPRVHDFRHTYCVNLLRKWVLEGKDLLNYLPYMKTMLGHETFNETAYYLRLTKEMYSDIILKLDNAFPNMIEEVHINDAEYH